MRFACIICVTLATVACTRDVVREPPPADTELGMSQPSPVRARFEDLSGRRIGAVDLRSDSIPKGAARVRAWTVGRTPVETVYLESQESGRRYELGRTPAGDFALDLSSVVKEEAQGEREDRTLRFRVVAVDHERKLTASEDLGLIVRSAPAH